MTSPLKHIEHAIHALRTIGDMAYRAEDLTFIARILPDGSGVEPVEHDARPRGPFFLVRLSITEDTYIAHGFNSFVVRRRTTR